MTVLVFLTGLAMGVSFAWLVTPPRWWNMTLGEMLERRAAAKKAREEKK